MLRRLAALVAGVLAFLAASSAAQARPAFWIVRDADSTILMFGSVHALPPGLAWTPPELTRALAEADDLWFEIPNDEAAALASSQTAEMRGALPPGRTLSAMLDAPTRTRLERAAASLGVPMAALERYRPWMAEVLLAAAYARRSGARPDEGVEARVSAAAPARVARRAFETPEQQIALLAGATDAAQIASLKESLSEIEDEPAGFREMIEAWMKGDVKGLYEDAVAPMRRKTPALYRRLVVDRNRAWARTIEDRLKGSGDTVMVMGAGHFVGPDGVPALLRRRGLKVEGP